MRHLKALLILAAMSLIWTWPLGLHFRDHIPGAGGDNYSFLWNLWWMRKALSAPELDFFHSNYLFNPFGVDLINHPHTALQGYLSATLLGGLSVIESENLYIIMSVFLNAVCAYALVYDVSRDGRAALIGAVAFGGSPYIAAHLMGHFDLLTAWVIPLFALCYRRSLQTGRSAPAMVAGACVAVAAYSAYYHVVYLALFAIAYTAADWEILRVWREPRPQRQALFTLRLVIVGLLAIDLFLITFIVMTGGTSVYIGDLQLSARRVQNPLALLWILGLAWLLTRWRLRIRFRRPGGGPFWRATQALAITTAVFAVLSLPLIVQAFRLLASGRYVSQVYFWRSAPRGVDALAPLMGNPFHSLYGRASSALYAGAGIDRIEAVGWIGVVPLLVLLRWRGRWLDGEEARRWKVVLIVSAIWSLGPFLTVGGFDMGLPLPQTLARFVPLVENARMPGRAMVVVYLALGVLMGLRLAGLKPRATAAEGQTQTTVQAQAVGQTAVVQGFSPGYVYALIALLALDYLHAPIPLTSLDRPPVYDQLASIDDNGPVIEVPFGIGDGLTVGVGSQERRLLFHATIHGHPVVGGYIGRMPPMVAQAYDAMPIVGNLLRLSAGREAVEEQVPPSVPFRYLVLDTAAASAALVDYVRSTLDMDLIASGGGKELYAVQGARASSLRARR